MCITLVHAYSTYMYVYTYVNSKDHSDYILSEDTISNPACSWHSVPELEQHFIQIRKACKISFKLRGSIDIHTVYIEKAVLALASLAWPSHLCFSVAKTKTGRFAIISTRPWYLFLLRLFLLYRYVSLFINGEMDVMKRESLCCTIPRKHSQTYSVQCAG